MPGNAPVLNTTLVKWGASCWVEGWKLRKRGTVGEAGKNFLAQDKKRPKLNGTHDKSRRIRPRKMNSRPSRNRRGSNYYRVLPWLGLPMGAAALYWVLRGLDPARLAAVISTASIFPLLLLPLSVLLEQWLRAVKWRLLLAPAKRVGTLRLFGAIMAGYFSNILAPLGISPFVRGWLIARIAAGAVALWVQGATLADLKSQSEAP